MSSQDVPAAAAPAAAATPKKAQGTTIDLQGVAAFARLVELLAQELGTNPGKMQGNLPSGPAAFNQLIGEFELNNQGFQRKLTLLSQPGSPLTLRFQSSHSENRVQEKGANPLQIVSDFYIAAAVEDIVPQGRALARYCEDIFTILDRMVTLGHSSKLQGMNVSAAEIEAFEYSESGNLVRQQSSRAST
ncbi:MAG: hypothetical protein IT343_07630 [Candidatus Melainabacteria bacterium]|jgi:hypothetical protein|nr:hypothetical protein [Candidatus Melainabacteria bacterium]